MVNSIDQMELPARDGDRLDLGSRATFEPSWSVSRLRNVQIDSREGLLLLVDGKTLQIGHLAGASSGGNESALGCYGPPPGAGPTSRDCGFMIWPDAQ